MIGEAVSLLVYALGGIIFIVGMVLAIHNQALSTYALAMLIGLFLVLTAIYITVSPKD